MHLHLSLRSMLDANGRAHDPRYAIVFNLISNDGDLDPVLFQKLQQNGFYAAGQQAGTLTEVYLSSFGVLNEGADWALVLTALSEGRWEEAGIAALPFVPAVIGKMFDLSREVQRENLQNRLTTTPNCSPETLITVLRLLGFQGEHWIISMTSTVHTLVRGYGRHPTNYSSSSVRLNGMDTKFGTSMNLKAG